MLLSDYRALILGYFNIGSGSSRLPTANIDLAVNIARNEILQDNDLSFGEKSTTLSTVANQQYVAKPSDFLRPLELYYIAAGATVKTQINQRVGKERFNLDYPDPTVTGGPVDFILWGNQILFGPTPDAVYTVYTDYYGLPAQLVNPTDGDPYLDLLGSAPAAVLYKALWHLGFFIMEDARAPTWLDMSRKFEQILVRDYTRANRSATAPQTDEPSDQVI